MSVIIDSIDSMVLRRALSHVGKEVTEIKPAGADLNTASSIRGIVSVLRIKAAMFHGLPGIVSKANAFCVVGMSMFVSARLANFRDKLLSSLFSVFFIFSLLLDALRTAVL